MKEQTETIVRLVEKTRWRLRLSWVMTGLGLTVGWLFGTLVAVAGLDVVLPLAPAARVAGLLAVLGSAIGAYAWTVVRPVWHPLTPIQVARRIERHLPGIHNRLVSCIDLMSNGTLARYSPAFCRRLISETHSRIQDFPPNTVVDRPRLRRAVRFGTACVAAFALALWLLPERLPTSLARVFAPLADIPPASGVAYSVRPGDAKLLRGDNLTFTVRVEHGDPARLQVEIQTDTGGRRLGYDLQKTDDRVWKFTLEGFDHSFWYRVVGGDTWSKRYRVTLLERPSLVEWHTVLHYPAYAGIAEPLVSKSQVADVTGPEGSEVEVVCEVKGSVVRGDLQFLALSTNAAPDAEPAVIGSWPMKRQGPGKWVGTMALTGTGFYRVDFRNEAGHHNQTIKPARFVAVPDQPPQVALERPGADLVLTSGGKVPLVIVAYDDLGLEEVSLAIRRGGSNEFASHVLKRYGTAQQSDAIVSSLDVPSLNLKEGEFVNYRIEARDRKGQTTRTRDFLVRIAADDRAADRQMTRLTRGQDLFAKRLADLIATQETVRASVNAMAAQYAPLAEQIQAARADVRPPPGGRILEGVTDAGSNAAPGLSTLDLQSVGTNLLAGMRQHLGDLVVLQGRNTESAQQFSADWSRATAAAAALPVVPVQMSDQMRLAQQAFDQMALAPMQGLTALMRQGAGTNSAPPDLEGMRRLSDRLQEGLENIRARMASLNDTTDRMQNDPGGAVDRLHTEMLNTRADMAAGELRNLQDALGDLMAEMRRLQGREEELVDTARDIPDAGLDGLETEQKTVEQQADPLLALTQQLLSTNQLAQLRRTPKFPQAPPVPEQGDYYVPPAEADTEEPSRTGDGNDARFASAAQTETDPEEEPRYLPALGGPPARLDPRFADKYRPSAQAIARAGSDAARQRREELSVRQWQRLRELNMAQQSVSADHATLESMVRRLQELADDPRQMSQWMQGQSVQQALQMAGILQQMAAAAAAAGPGGRNTRPGPAWMRSWAATGGGGAGWMGTVPAEGAIPELDANARTVILLMQPRVREELLQGMREDGPEPYRSFIENYYKQLTKVKTP